MLRSPSAPRDSRQGDINLASDLYISPRVVTAGSLTDPVWRTTLFVQTVTRESVAL